MGDARAKKGLCEKKVTLEILQIELSIESNVFNIALFNLHEVNYRSPYLPA